jgi:2-keto-4-pentenoate hydratase/2-oxohepta-3-ene-1,7-dioic acid hydratase in catechol pathway
MKLYLGLTENSDPHQTQVFFEADGKLLDLNPAHAAYLALRRSEKADAQQACYFPETITGFLQRGEPALEVLEELLSFARKSGVQDLCGLAGEKVVYDPAEIRILPPLQKPEKSIVIGFSDQARSETTPESQIPTGFYKLPQTFVTSGAPIIWPKFAEELDADACLAIVIGKPGKRIEPTRAWEYVGAVTLLIDVTARDINRREALTTNNLLGKNFPSSTSLGPALLLKPAREELEAMAVELSIDGSVRQRFKLNECIFTIEQIIARWSILGIKPGDFLAIGASMARQGERLQSPAPLKMGSQLRCFAPALGELSHQVVSAGGLGR